MKPQHEVIRNGKWCGALEMYVHPKYAPCPKRCGMRGTLGCVMK
jgi:hypothetical protein